MAGSAAWSAFPLSGKNAKRAFRALLFKFAGSPIWLADIAIVFPSVCRTTAAAKILCPTGAAFRLCEDVAGKKVLLHPRIELPGKEDVYKRQV